jgi:hypothetical protein
MPGPFSILLARNAACVLLALAAAASSLVVSCSGAIQQGTAADAGEHSTPDATFAETGPGPSDAGDGGCAVGTLSCAGPQPQLCNGYGAWQNVGAPCSGATDCVNGACVGDAGVGPDDGGGPDGAASDGAASDGAASDGAANDAPWGCLDMPPDPSSPSSVYVTLVAFDGLQPTTFGGPAGGTDLTLLQGTLLPGVSVSACDAHDPACQTPIAGPTVTDDAGVAHVGVAGTFAGFFSLHRADLLPTLALTGRLLADEPQISFPVWPASLAGMQQLGIALGVAPNLDPTKGPGHLFFTAYDCSDRFAYGVSFVLENTDGGVQYYVLNQYPTTSAQQTDQSGAGGVVNVPSGDVAVAAMLGNRMLAAFNVPVRPGADSTVFVRARAHP